MRFMRPSEDHLQSEFILISSLLEGIIQERRQGKSMEKGINCLRDGRGEKAGKGSQGKGSQWVILLAQILGFTYGVILFFLQSRLKKTVIGHTTLALEFILQVKPHVFFSNSSCQLNHKRSKFTYSNIRSKARKDTITAASWMRED